MGAQGIYTVVGPLPRGSDNDTVLALREEGRERKGVVLRPLVHGVEPVQAPTMPGLVPMLGFDEVDGNAYALYEFLPSVTLREILEAFRATQRRAPLGLTGRIIVDAARVVSALHTGAQAVVHGALHDGAVLVGFEGTTRLIDLGSGRRSRYDAPEVERGEAASPRSDVYSLAAMMHAAATGFAANYAAVGVRGPASADLPPPSKHHADAVAELDTCLFRALATNAQARVASARLFADELERALAGKIFSRDQVGATLSELFGDRVAALKSLISRATEDTEPPKPARPSRPKNPVSESPTAPRPSGPKPRASAPPPRMIPGTNIPADTQAGQGGGIVLEQQVVLVESDADAHPTRPPRSRPSAPAAKRSSRPDNPVVRPGPPVPDRAPERAAPPPIDDEAPATGVEPAYRPPRAVDSSAALGAPAPMTPSQADLGPPVPSGESQPDLRGPISVGNDPESDSGALGVEDNPTAIRPRASLTGMPRQSNVELKQQTEEEKAVAAGQEKISTAELDPENQGELASLQDEPPAEAEPTNVKARPKPPPGRAPLDDDRGEGEGEDVSVTRPKAKKKGGAARIFLLFIVLAGAFTGLSWKFRPWRGKPLPAWLPPRIAELAIADGALGPGGEQPMEVVQMPPDQQAPVPEQDLGDGGRVAEEPSVDGGAAHSPLVALVNDDAGTAEPAPAAVVDAGAAAPAPSSLDAGVKAPEKDKGEHPGQKKKKRRH